MEYDLKHHVKPVIALKIADYSGATDGQIIDTVGYESLTFVVATGTVTSASVIKIEHGEKDDLSDATAVDAEHLLDALPSIADTDDDVTKWFGYIGKKRYVRVSFVSGSATMGVVGLYGHPLSMPTA